MYCLECQCKSENSQKNDEQHEFVWKWIFVVKSHFNGWNIIILLELLLSPHSLWMQLLRLFAVAIVDAYATWEMYGQQRKRIVVHSKVLIIHKNYDPVILY